MNSKELEQLKDKYAMGTLSPEEHANLEVELLQNSNLKKDLKIHKDMVNGVQYAGQLELKEIIDKIHNEHIGEKPKKKINTVISLAIGLLSLLAIIGYFILNENSEGKTSPTLIYAEFYTQYKPSILNRGTSLDEAIIKFNEAYIDKNYQEALQIIKPYLAESNNEIKLTAAIAANEADDLILSQKLLDDIIADDDYYFGDHARWYKALIKLKTNEINSIKEILAPLIANPKADHHAKAIDLVAKIEG